MVDILVRRDLAAVHGRLSGWAAAAGQHAVIPDEAVNPDLGFREGCAVGSATLRQALARVVLDQDRGVWTVSGGGFGCMDGGSFGERAGRFALACTRTRTLFLLFTVSTTTRN